MLFEKQFSLTSFLKTFFKLSSFDMNIEFLVNKLFIFSLLTSKILLKIFLSILFLFKNSYVFFSS